MTRPELIAALQSAAEGSDEFDGEIHFAVMQPGWDRDPPPKGAVEQFKRSCPYPYTRSVDAALSLLPGAFECRINAAFRPRTGFVKEASATLEVADNRYSAVAKTPALALYIADSIKLLRPKLRGPRWRLRLLGGGELLGVVLRQIVGNLVMALLAQPRDGPAHPAADVIAPTLPLRQRVRAHAREVRSRINDRGRRIRSRGGRSTG